MERYATSQKTPSQTQTTNCGTRKRKASYPTTVCTSRLGIFSLDATTSSAGETIKLFKSFIEFILLFHNIYIHT